MRNYKFGLLLVLFSVFLVGGCAKKEVVSGEEPVVPAVKAVPEVPPPPPQPVPPPAPARTEVVQEQAVMPVPEGKDVPAETARKTTLETVYFDYDRSDLRKADREILTRNAGLLMDKVRGNIKIEGHSDERGSAEYNLALGERRARSAMNYLVTLGVPADRLSIISYGEEMPAAPGHDEEAWARNRRVQFVNMGE